MGSAYAGFDFVGLAIGAAGFNGVEESVVGAAGEYDESVTFFYGQCHFVVEGVWQAFAVSILGVEGAVGPGLGVVLGQVGDQGQLVAEPLALLDVAYSRGVLFEYLVLEGDVAGTFVPVAVVFFVAYLLGYQYGGLAVYLQKGFESPTMVFMSVGDDYVIDVLQLNAQFLGVFDEERAVAGVEQPVEAVGLEVHAEAVFVVKPGLLGVGFVVDEQGDFHFL